jgi:hypothetical protein
MIELGHWKVKKRPHSLAQLLAEDAVVAKRGKPGLPKLKFMEGLGPEDPKFDVDGNDTQSRAA